MRRLLLSLCVAAGAMAQSPVDFAKDVEPIFKRSCLGCHGPAVQTNGLRFDDGPTALRGGYSGPVILPGKATESEIIRRVMSDKSTIVMPPTGPRLTNDEISRLQAWINAGAVWPQSAKPVARRRGSSHWAFQPVQRQTGSIDSYVLARLQKEGLTPSPRAGRPQLIRRLKLDLLGLPPTPEEVAAFVADARPDAYERLVDSYLASPHYGEKWARQWLDLARYADSDGYEKDQARLHAWRYRQWVINALNADLPFDQFTIEQIAGDLLPQATTEQRVATGFHRNVRVNREAGVDRAEARFEQLINRTNTVTTTWLGLTAGCAQCHDHKYDPISQKEYYQLFSFFNSADDVDIDAPLAGEMGPYLRALPEYRKRRQSLIEENNIPAMLAGWEEKMRAAWANPGKDPEFDFWVTSMSAMFDHAKRVVHTPFAKRSQRDQDRLINYFVANPGPQYRDNKEVTEKLKQLRAKLQELDAGFPALTQAYTIAAHPEAPVTKIAIRGDYKNLGIPVEPGTLAILPPLQEPGRLGFARWLVSRENPLTARVIANRAWQEFFGRGLVKTSEDFGTQGDKPSHPELLDALATRFVDQGWSMKKLHRLIVTSATYQQSSKYRPEVAEKDPENMLLARQSRLRLPAEQIRDAALFAGEILSLEIGGKSIKPPLPKGVAELGYGNSVKWAESTGRERYRRGLYEHYQRTTPYPQLVNFDAPDSNVACSRRRTSNTPLQALNLLNDPTYVEAARFLALRMIREGGDTVDSRLTH
ncbi:MAG: PSD1 and planctomycete cytochrome C domain-containing protein, partial [Acidobacteriota bacterium]